MTYVQPFFPALVLLSVVGFLVCLRQRTRWRVAALGVGVFGAALFSWPPVAWLASGTLEWRYPVQPLPDGEVDAIVVLSGHVFEPQPYRPYEVADRGTYWRCYHAGWLYANWRQVPVIACGANQAAEMERILRKEGVPKQQLWIDRQSSRTAESARNVAEMVRAKGIQRVALVTDAFHMLRAEACFKKQGFQVIPAPCVFRSTRFRLKLDGFLPGATAIRQNEDTLHEWIGIVWYKLKGWI